jgi:hypothetical protein
MKDTTKSWASSVHQDTTTRANLRHTAHDTRSRTRKDLSSRQSSSRSLSDMEETTQIRASSVPRQTRDALSHTMHSKGSSSSRSRDDMRSSEHSQAPRIRRDALYTRQRNSTTTKNGNRKSTSLVDPQAIAIATSVKKRQSSCRSLTDESTSPGNPIIRKSRRRSDSSLSGSKTRRERSKSNSGSRVSQSRRYVRSVSETRRRSSRSSNHSRAHGPSIVGGEVSTSPRATRRPRSVSRAGSVASLGPVETLSPKSVNDIESLVHSLRRETKRKSLAKIAKGSRNLLVDEI